MSRRQAKKMFYGKTLIKDMEARGIYVRTASFSGLAEEAGKAYKDIDDVVERYSSNWKVRRMACVDRNVLRLAVFELLYCEDIPTKVSINEAIDIAKKFGASESGSFINGILDSIRTALEKDELKTIPQTSSDVGSVAPADEVGKEKL